MSELRIIGYIHTDLKEKFGVPRQSGLVPALTGRIVFEAEFKSRDFIKGLEGFNYLWLLWRFDGVDTSHVKSTVRPPRLGGNKTMGVFATRSPFRPNPIGLSSVKLEKIDFDDSLGPILTVSGVDMKDGTAIYDIKPYLPYTDIHTDALGGFGADHLGDNLTVVFPDELKKLVPGDKLDALIGLLREDPRPHYQDDPERIYGLSYAGLNVSFTVDKEIRVIKIAPE